MKDVEALFQVIKCCLLRRMCGWQVWKRLVLLSNNVWFIHIERNVIPINKTFWAQYLDSKIGMFIILTHNVYRVTMKNLAYIVPSWVQLVVSQGSRCHVEVNGRNVWDQYVLESCLPCNESYFTQFYWFLWKNLCL